MTDVTTVVPAVPAVAPVAEGEFRIGPVFSRTLTLLLHNFPIYFAVAALAAVPGVLLETAGADKAAAAALAPLGLLAMLVFGPLSQAIMLYTAFQDMGGRRVVLSESIGAAFRRWLPLIGLAICMGIGIGVGFIFLVVPGLILATMWYVATPACIVERRGVFDSMARSSALTKGHRWPIFGVMLLLGIGGGVMAAVIKAVLVLSGSAGLVIVGSLAWSALAGAFGTIFVVVAYHDLRVAKEGVDIRQNAAVFD
ncbi:MAG TPA: hypothetical protein VK456_17650 [Xanthobacteraceae bacterium]|nr:hypothetical protein [Xanthobacteraceae bacterium]